jgi:hypothetical protein
MKKIIEIEGKDLRAQKELLMSSPLNGDEFKKLKARIPYVPLAGESFDEINSIYPLLIPESPRIFTVNGQEGVYSLFLKQNKTSVSLIGDDELKDLYLAHGGHFIYGVGIKIEKQKNGKTYHNMKLRGWLLVKIKKDKESAKKGK